MGQFLWAVVKLQVFAVYLNFLEAPQLYNQATFKICLLQICGLPIASPAFTHFSCCFPSASIESKDATFTSIVSPLSTCVMIYLTLVTYLMLVDMQNYRFFFKVVLSNTEASSCFLQFHNRSVCHVACGVIHLLSEYYKELVAFEKDLPLKIVEVCLLK